jgi:dihydrofolate synthase/folylpolyglutamate synthase
VTYREALAYLESLESLGIRPGLDRIHALLERLGDPHLTFPSVLIGGTNGKGSVTAFLSSILGAAGVRRGVYISPHLVRFEERVAVDGDPISGDEVASLTSEVATAIEAGRRAGVDPPTYFEATTALAFLHFSRRRVPIALLEVGMGGRYDATNVVQPLACAITSVAMDHEQWLGRTLQEIAWQKAGIIRRGVPLVVAHQEGPALGVIRDEAQRLGAPLVGTESCRVRPWSGGPGHSDPPVFSLSTPSGRHYDRLAISLRGDHQVDNASVAVLLAETLAAGPLPGLDLEAVPEGLKRAEWPARIEILPGRPEILLDGAHNPAGCRTLAAYVRDHQPGRRVVLVFAAMKDKPAAEMLDILCPLAEEVIVTALPVSRGETPRRLHELAAVRGAQTVIEPSIPAALERARAGAGENGLVVASGSLYLAGEIKKILARR